MSRIPAIPQARQLVKGILKGAFDSDGVLHLDGEGMLYGREAPLTEFFAHEMVHSIDGNSHEFSASQAWPEAWLAEIEFFTGSGRNSPTEAFAEFGQMLLGDPRMKRKLMRQAMPRCLQVWEDFGL
jgi:hypothetical protein